MLNPDHRSNSKPLELFEIFYSLGPTRSISKLAKEVGMTEGNLRKISHKEVWGLRLRQRVEEDMLAARQLRIARLAGIEEEYVEVGGKLRGISVEAIEAAHQSGDLLPRDAVNVLKVATSLEMRGLRAPEAFLAQRADGGEELPKQAVAASETATDRFLALLDRTGSRSSSASVLSDQQRAALEMSEPIEETEVPRVTHRVGGMGVAWKRGSLRIGAGGKFASNKPQKQQPDGEPAAQPLPLEAAQ